MIVLISWGILTGLENMLEAGFDTPGRRPQGRVICPAQAHRVNQWGWKVVDCSTGDVQGELETGHKFAHLAAGFAMPGDLARREHLPHDDPERKHISPRLWSEALEYLRRRPTGGARHWSS